ncbi:radical SAM family heme chaperone HemW [Maritimibacter fusiformis]|uniref:Heme chaperone HemW n=1 Tax=Maritimibacter fusiformis TaxID=2603819 RepID=A0A5D0R8D1_9RHOB|nr:radical SAM family heme chaperone HemW [Maritimibacter fusiformis]TYB77737.1 coproporphyrinogen III oxidase [Maritimibacter fusiformis]
MPDDWRFGGFGLYVHWPFCAAKCPYCDFNSHVSAKIEMEDWRAAYKREIARYASETGPRVLNSVYFGGGTPSLMAPEIVETVIETAAKHWTFANDIEITLEANPTSVEAGKFADFRHAGVSRVSLGVQALNDADLRRLGRLHDVATAMTALETARNAFDRVSFDLIYARQDQSLSDWRQELTTALGFSPEHLSLYQLTIESGTAFGDRFRRGKLPGLPDEDLAADMFILTQDICDAAGLPAYEVSNHAVPGQESRHNLIYWHGGDYVGIGPGAHGRLTLDGQRHATTTELSPGKWLSQVSRTGTGELEREALRPRDHAGEYLMMSLRTTEGLDMKRYRDIAGKPINMFDINDLENLGLLQSSGDRLQATRDGRAVLNAIITRLLPDD